MLSIHNLLEHRWEVCHHEPATQHCIENDMTSLMTATLYQVIHLLVSAVISTFPTLTSESDIDMRSAKVSHVSANCRQAGHHGAKLGWRCIQCVMVVLLMTTLYHACDPLPGPMKPLTQLALVAKICVFFL